MLFALAAILPQSAPAPAFGASAYSVEGKPERVIDFGDGSDGAFADGTSAPGFGGAAPNFTLNTDVQAEFQFSSFTLSAGNTITVTGTAPAVIRVNGATVIDGTIDLSGAAGVNGTNTGAVIAGGAGGPGGGDGGDSGLDFSEGLTAPEDGQAFGNAAGGTAGANAPQGFQGGGGGGCNGPGAGNPTQGGGAAGACTLTRAEIADLFEEDFFGGGGGAGGTANTDNPGTAGDPEPGSGGGGGGAIRIASLGDLSLTGQIIVSGGDGGDLSGLLVALTDAGAAGGGGAGGSIWLQTAGTLTGGAGTVIVAGGAAGTDLDALFSPNYHGGAGSQGVVRIDAKNNSSSIAADLEYGVDQLTDFFLEGGLWCSTARVVAGDDKNGVPPSPTGGLATLFLIFGSALLLRIRYGRA
ncbi:MAG: hypothetical protein IT285_14575 [Bdellovibrionales bacterium]|nr:hypothetical protein [Bdellovibrionales bacterium]